MVAISCFYDEKQVVMVYNFFMMKKFGYNLNISMMKLSGHFHNKKNFCLKLIIFMMKNILNVLVTSFNFSARKTN